MIKLRITAFAVTVVTAVSLMGGAAAAAPMAARAVPQVPLTIIGHATGQGATAQAAETAAVTLLGELFYGCGPHILVYDTQRSDGTWIAEVEANCAGVF